MKGWAACTGAIQCEMDSRLVKTGPNQVVFEPVKAGSDSCDLDRLAAKKLGSPEKTASSWASGGIGFKNLLEDPCIVGVEEERQLSLTRLPFEGVAADCLDYAF